MREIWSDLCSKGTVRCCAGEDEGQLCSFAEAPVKQAVTGTEAAARRQW
jgi:Holliday junction resolvasome RuvABC endonuclease subunit